MQSEISLKLIRDHSGSQKTLLRMKKQPKHQNKTFISKQQRFPTIKSAKNQQPGPGAYIDPLARSRQIQTMQNSPKRRQENHLDCFVARQHQWIFGSNRLNLTNNGSGLGPGTYQVVAKNMEKSLHSWSKADRFSGNDWSQNNSEVAVGPGAYQLSQTPKKHKKKQGMGIFKSKSPKTFIQKLQNDMQKVRDLRVDSNGFQPFYSNDNRSETSELAGSKILESKKAKMDPCFLSRSKRYELINPENGVAGPGSYDSEAIIKPRAKRIKSVSTSIHQSKKPQSGQKERVPQPGPTSYSIDKYNLQKQIQKKISSLKGSMSLQSRFKIAEKTNSTTMPGPGHYNRQRYQFIDQKLYQHKPLVSHHQKIQIPFMTSVNRAYQQINKVPFGNYNLNQFDMGQRINKRREHLQKLRAMDISVPGFESSERRTTFNLGKLVKEQFQKLKGAGKRVQSNSSLHKG